MLSFYQGLIEKAFLDCGVSYAAHTEDEQN